MCGLAGILTSRQGLDVAGILARMRASLRHRGPDDEGQQIIQTPAGFRVGLAHTRLAILDLSPAGRQPMCDTGSGSSIVYNGETYNHRQIREEWKLGEFRSTSDTATILKAWEVMGQRTLEKLRGMFAFAMYDAPRNQFWLVRDRLGIKPLYIARGGNGTWIFASEVRALLASGLVARRLNREGLESYLAFGSVIAPLTLIEGVQCVMPGRWWRFDLERPDRLEPQTGCYWRAPFTSHSAARPARAAAVERIREALDESTRLRTLSDVPVGVFLSGGIDSSGLVAALTHAGHALRTYSVTFDEYRFDESTHSNAVARAFGTSHTELRLRSRYVLNNFDRAVAAYDQPSIDGLNSYFISEEVRRAGITVALSGLGGDEFFAGYPSFRVARWLEQPLARWPMWLLYRILSIRKPSDSRVQKLGDVLRAGRSQLDRYTAMRQVTLPSQRSALTYNDAPRRAQLPASLSTELDKAVRDLDPINSHSLLESSVYMSNVLLRDTDQMSMAHALEVRVPLIDHLLVESVASLPGNMKVAAGTTSSTKGLLVDALPAPLPESVVRRRKMGFVFPWESWLRGELKDQVGQTLADRNVCEQTGLNPAAISSLWNAFLMRRPGVRQTDILALANLFAWVRCHKVSLDEVGTHRASAA